MLTMLKMMRGTLDAAYWNNTQVKGWMPSFSMKDEGFLSEIIRYHDGIFKVSLDMSLQDQMALS